MHLARLCIVNVQMHAVGGRSGRRQRKCHWVISGRENMLGGLCNIKSTLKNVRRTVVTKATQSIHTQTTASPIHRKNKD